MYFQIKFSIIIIKYIYIYIYIYSVCVYVCVMEDGMRYYLLHHIVFLVWSKILPNECSWYDIKPSDGKTPVLEISSTPSLPLLPGPL